MTETTVPASVDPLGADWLRAACQGLQPGEADLLRAAADWVHAPLRGVHASTGELLTTHSAAVVLILRDLGSDAETRAAALLSMQPVPEGGLAHGDPLRAAFGPDIASLVQGIRALLRLGTVARQADVAPGTEQKEMQRKMLLAMAADLRIVLVRLASRLQSLRWHAVSHTPCPAEFAQETMNLYAPLANRLGIWQLKWEMEDLCFRFLQPDTYRGIARQLEEKRTEREAFVEDVVARLRIALHEARIEADISGRPKHIYSIWNKMRIKHLEFHQLFDLRALRVIVADERACYAALAVVHSLWTPVPEEFDDYIARPKPNGYRSLHTVVADVQGRAFEVQIRTREMHQYAEFGMAAHWRYKEAGARGGQVAASGEYDRRIAWMRRLLAWREDGGAAPAAAPGAAGPERIYVMTPQARVLELPEGATPVDFAYALHTDLGHRCRGARVDGQMVALATVLKTGQTVEIVAAKSGGPSRDWLNPQLGYLASARARAKVRAWFNAVELQQRIAQGQALVEKELQRLGRTAVNQDHLAQQLGFARADDLYVAAAKEEFSLRQIEHALRPADPVPAATAGLPAPGGADAAVRAGKGGVLVVGVGSLLTQLARCCRPAPPDAIEGFVTRGRGVSVHRRDCSAWRALARRHPERCIEVAWGASSDAVYPVDITVHAQDRPNLLRDLSETFARLRLRVVRVTTYSRRSLAHMVFTIEVRDGQQIRQALDAVNELAGVQAARH